MFPCHVTSCYNAKLLSSLSRRLFTYQSEPANKPPSPNQIALSIDFLFAWTSSSGRGRCWEGQSFLHKASTSLDWEATKPTVCTALRHACEMHMHHDCPGREGRLSLCNSFWNTQTYSTYEAAEEPSQKKMFGSITQCTAMPCCYSQIDSGEFFNFDIKELETRSLQTWDVWK